MNFIKIFVPLSLVFMLGYQNYVASDNHNEVNESNKKADYVKILLQIKATTKQIELSKKDLLTANDLGVTIQIVKQIYKKVEYLKELLEDRQESSTSNNSSIKKALDSANALTKETEKILKQLQKSNTASTDKIEIKTNSLIKSVNAMFQ